MKEELPAGCAYDTFPPIEPDHIAKTLTEALNRLQAEVWAGPGELQLKGTVDLTVPSSGDTCIPGVLLKTKDSQDSHALDNPSTSSPRTGNPSFVLSDSLYGISSDSAAAESTVEGP